MRINPSLVEEPFLTKTSQHGLFLTSFPSLILGWFSVPFAFKALYKRQIVRRKTKLSDCVDKPQVTEGRPLTPNTGADLAGKPLFHLMIILKQLLKSLPAFSSVSLASFHLLWLLQE